MSFRKITMLFSPIDENGGTGGTSVDQGGQSGTDGQGVEGGENPSGKPAETPDDIVKKLREENAKRRVENNNLKTQIENFQNLFKKASGSEEQVNPEVELGKLREHAEALEAKLAIAEIRIQNNIPAEHGKYFEYLINEKLNNLGEGEEFGDEQIFEILEQVKGLGTKQMANTSVGTGAKPKEQGTEGLTVESFAKMTITEKSKLYQTKPDLYTSMFKQAKDKRLL